MSLKPLRIETDCVFQCPTCEAETWYTIRELQHREHLSCICGKRTRITPVKHVEVFYVSKETEQLSESGQRTRPAINLDDFVVSLVAIGHKKAAAKTLIKQCQDEYTGDDQTFLELLLNKGKA